MKTPIWLVMLLGLAYIDVSHSFAILQKAVPRIHPRLPVLSQSPVSQPRSSLVLSMSNDSSNNKGKVQRPSTTEAVDSMLFGSGLYRSRLIDNVFRKADTNKDGTVSISETYELVLKIYVLLNRQGPLAPPSKENINLIFQECDINNDQSIDRSEFGRLVNVLIRRAFWRLAAYKAVSLIGAPLLTEYIVRLWRRKQWLLLWVHQTAAPWPRLERLLTSGAFWRTVLLCGFVSTLGNLVLGLVNWTMDYSRYVNNLIMEELGDSGTIGAKVLGKTGNSTSIRGSENE